MRSDFVQRVEPPGTGPLRRLHDALQGRGVGCWVDEKQMLPGDDTYEQVDRGIRLWDKVLLCCSVKGRLFI